MVAMANGTLNDQCHVLPNCYQKLNFRKTRFVALLAKRSLKRFKSVQAQTGQNSPKKYWSNSILDLSILSATVNFKLYSSSYDEYFFPTTRAPDIQSGMISWEQTSTYSASNWETLRSIDTLRSGPNARKRDASRSQSKMAIPSSDESGDGKVLAFVGAVGINSTSESSKILS